MVSFINKDGEITQYTDIPKFQHTTSDGGTYSSYMLFEKDDRVFIIYHDDPKNFSSNIKSARDISIMSNPKTADLVAVEILPDGKYTKRRLFNNGDKNLTTYIHSAEKIGNGVITSYSIHYTKLYDPISPSGSTLLDVVTQAS